MRRLGGDLLYGFVLGASAAAALVILWSHRYLLLDALWFWGP